MKSSYDNNIYNKSNIFNNNVNSSRSFFGNSSKLENLQNLYFHLNPYSNSTAIKSNQQIKDLEKFQNQTEPDSLDKKYAQPNRNNYKRFHFKVEEVKKGKSFNSQSPYSPVAREKNMAFYSLGDLSVLHPLTYQRIQSTKKFINSNNMKNNMRLQIVEEKMRKLEEKNEGLQILNNIFFDSLKDNINQSLKRKAFLKRHLKDIEYLKKINIDEYNDKVDYINKLVEENNIDFDNYNYEGEPIGGADNLEGKMEAMKTEIGTLLTKNTLQNDANLNLLKNDEDNNKNDLEKKINEFNYLNNKNFDIIQDFLLREEKDRLIEKKKKEEEERIKKDKLLFNFTPSKNEKFHIKGVKKKEKKIKKVNTEESEVSSESNKNLDVVDKMFLDSLTVSINESKNKKSNTETNDDEDRNGKEIDLRSDSSKTKVLSKRKKPKWKLLHRHNSGIIEEEDNSSDNKVEGDENVIIGSYKSNFDSNKPEIITKRSKNSKRFKISKESKTSNNNEEEEENESESNNDESKGENDENENKINNNIEGSYKSKFSTNKPELDLRNKRSQKSKKFTLSNQKNSKNDKNKNLKEGEENMLNSENQKSNPKSKNKTGKKSKKEEIEEDDDEDNEEDSSSETKTFQLTNKTGEKNKNNLNLKDIKEDEELYLGSEISNLKSNDKKSKRSRKSKKSKKISKNNKTVKEEKEEDDE